MVDNTDDATKDPDIFNTYPRRIYKIQWKGKIRNEDLWERVGLELL